MKEKENSTGKCISCIGGGGVHTSTLVDAHPVLLFEGGVHTSTLVDAHPVLLFEGGGSALLVLPSKVTPTSHK